MDYIESKYEEYLNAESRVQRQPMRDNRVHVCLYFIQPSGHGLKPLDIEFMKRLHDKVNVIPILAKADTMTPDECTHFKKQVHTPFMFFLWCVHRTGYHFIDPQSTCHTRSLFNKFAFFF